MSWRTCKTLLILELSLVPSYEDLVEYNQYSINECQHLLLLYQSYYTCQISDVAESDDGTLDMLALQLWEDQLSCQQSMG